MHFTPHIRPAGQVQSCLSKKAYNVDEAQKEDDLDDEEDARQDPCNLRRDPSHQDAMARTRKPIGIVALQKQGRVLCSSAQRVSW